MTNGFKTTYIVAVSRDDVSEGLRYVQLIFDDEQAEEESMCDYYSSCYHKIQAWLVKHFPGLDIDDNVDAAIEAYGNWEDMIQKETYTAQVQEAAEDCIDCR